MATLCTNYRCEYNGTSGCAIKECIWSDLDTRPHAKSHTIVEGSVGWICPKCRASVSPVLKICPVCCKTSEGNRLYLEDIGPHKGSTLETVVITNCM